MIDGRLAFYFIPHSFRVFLTVDHETGTRRISNDIRPDEDTKDFDSLYDSLKKRVESDDRRFKKIYGIHFLDEKNYDLVIDTSDITQEEAAEKIIREAKKLRS